MAAKVHFLTAIELYAVDYGVTVFYCGGDRTVFSVELGVVRICFIWYVDSDLISYVEFSHLYVVRRSSANLFKLVFPILW